MIRNEERDRERKNKWEILLAPPLIKGYRLAENQCSLCQATPSTLPPLIFLPYAAWMGQMACVFFFLFFFAFTVMIKLILRLCFWVCILIYLSLEMFERKDYCVCSRSERRDRELFFIELYDFLSRKNLLELLQCSLNQKISSRLFKALFRKQTQKINFQQFLSFF